jgi:parallel beta-helix repeat protein
MGRVRRVVALVSTLALLFVGSALTTTASASHIGCGSVITENTTLDGDVGPCNEGDGLVVAASNITLDLAGHRVFSSAPLPRMTPDRQPVDVVGIYLDDVTNVTVKNGTVHGFAAGVAIDFGGSNRVTGITARDNQGPCIGEDFTTQSVGTYGDGIVLFSSTNNRIEGNTVLRNGPFSGISVVANTFMINRIVGSAPSGNLIRGNNVDDNNNCWGDIGVRIEGPGATNNTVAGNRVNRSFHEGVMITGVNNINFSGLFRNPPTCQVRGFAGIPPVPHPELPTCPGFTGADRTPANNNNVISGNQVGNNGFGGPQNPPASIPSPQSAAGILLNAFCVGSPEIGEHLINGSGNVVHANAVVGNAGSGIHVGGCPPTDLPQFAPTPGFTNSHVVNNLAVRNNQAGCVPGPANPNCGGNFDLLDTNNAIVCPSSSPGTQSICATLGFGPPTAGPFAGTRVVVPGYPACDNNVWFGNVYGTAFPPCTTLGGRQVGASQPAPTARSVTSGTVAEETGTRLSASPIGERVASRAQRGHRAR